MYWIIFFTPPCICSFFSPSWKRQPLPLSTQNYPLHGNEVNGFHPAPTTYSHTPAINGESIMGENATESIRPYSVDGHGFRRRRRLVT